MHLLLATYKSLHDAHRAIHGVHARFGLASEHVGCAFVVSPSPQDSLGQTIMAKILGRRRAEDCGPDAKQVARFVAGTLHKAVLPVMVNGGALVVVQCTHSVSEELLIGTLQDCDAHAVVVAPETRNSDDAKLPRQTLGGNIRLLGQLARAWSGGLKRLR